MAIKKNNSEVSNIKNSFLIRWAKYFVDRWRVSIILLIAIVIAGLFGVMNNQRQDFPDVPINYISISATYRGASAENIEKEVVVPIEQAIENVEGVKEIISYATNNWGSITAEMEFFDNDLLSKRSQEMRDEISKVNLPEDADFDVTTFDISGPSVVLGIVSSEGKPIEEVLPYVSKIENELLAASDQIKEFSVSPKDEFEIRVNLDLAALQKAGLTSTDVQNAIKANLTTLPGGEVTTEDGYKKAINMKLAVNSLDDLENISLGNSLKIKDVADIERKAASSNNLVTAGYVKDGQPMTSEAVYLMAMKKTDGDVITMSEDIMSEVNKIKAENKIPDDIEIYNIYDSSVVPDENIKQLIESGVWGLILVLVVLMFFIDIRTGIVISIILPLAFLISFAVLYFLGFTLNILTLFGMILCLGILVDNAIVIAEGMMYELERGASKRNAALITVKKLGPAVTSATLTTVVVFIPFAQMGGIMGEIMKYIPYTIIIMLLGSYFLAMSITPLFGRWLLKEKGGKRKLSDYVFGIALFDWKEDKKGKPMIEKWQKRLILPAIVFYGQKFINTVADLYKRFMFRTLRSFVLKSIVLMATLVVIIGGFYIVGSGKLEFSQMPEVSSNMLAISADFPTGMPFELKKEVVLKVASEIVKIPRFESYVDLQGEGLYIMLEDYQKGDITDEEINDQLNNQIQKITVNYKDVEIKSGVSYMGPPADDYNIIVNIQDEDLGDLKNAADDLTAYLSSEEEVNEVVNTYDENLLEAIQVDFEEPFSPADNVPGAGISMATMMINNVFSEIEIGRITVREDGVSDKIVMGYQDEYTDEVSDLANLFVNTQGQQLKDKADVQEIKSLNSIRRKDKQRVVSLKIDLKDADKTAEFQTKLTDYLGLELDSQTGEYVYMEKDRVEELEKGDSSRNINYDKLGQLNLGKESISFGGQYSAVATDVNRLVLVMILAFIGVFIILVNQFHSYVQPSLIMTTVVMASAGVFYGLAAIGEKVSLISGLGIVALIGIAVNDAIVFIDTYNRMKKQHPEAGLSSLLSQTGHLRFKPIFSTSITTILGVLPITLMDPFWKGLGTAIIAGLIFSTLGTLIVIPLMYRGGIWFWGHVVLCWSKKRRVRYFKEKYGREKN